MEYITESDPPVWIGMLANILEAEGNVGSIAFRNNSAIRKDLSPAVFVGCIPRGSSSNYSTSVSDLVYSMSSANMQVNTLICDKDKYADFRRILPGNIVGKYYSGFDILVAFVSDRAVLAICDMDTKEIFIPDVSSEIGWNGDSVGSVELIASLISDVIGIMDVRNINKLLSDIDAASRASVNVTLLDIRAETTFDKDGFIASCMQSLKGYEQTLEDSYRNVFNDMQNQVKIAQSKGVVEALELMKYMKDMHFVFTDPHTIKYTGGRIVANTAIYNDALYETKSELWISGLKVVVENGVVVAAKCYRAYHPNCSGRHVCIGELSGIPIRDVQKLVDSLTVPNFSNGYWSGSVEYLGKKIIDLEGDTERIWSSDD